MKTGDGRRETGEGVTRGYRDLLVWQRSMALIPPTYGIAKQLPDDERHALSNQIRRAVISVPANIAEGQARRSTKEFSQFLSIALGSLAELDTLLESAVLLGYAKRPAVDPLQDEIRQIRAMIRTLMHRQAKP